MRRLPRRTSQLSYAFATVAAITCVVGPARAHHEALFGPQSSLAVESSGFVSLQTHIRAYGVDGTETQEQTFIASAGVSPFADIPWSITIVQPYTYQTSRVPTPSGSTGPFTTCDGCFRRENNLIATAYRFDFKGVQRATGKDGNFALLSAALETPTGDKDYAPLNGPFNGIVAGMVGFEVGAWAAVGLGYFRINTSDSTSSHKGDSALFGAGVAYTPIDRDDAILSFQVGMGEEIHLHDVQSGAEITPSGGAELLVSPTIVGSPFKHARFFALMSLPVAQTYGANADRDRWRAGFGVIYSFDREPAAATLERKTSMR